MLLRYLAIEVFKCINEINPAYLNAMFIRKECPYALKDSCILIRPKVNYRLAEWRSGSVTALPCERPGFASRTRLREIIPANNCTMQGQNNWGNLGSSGVMKLWVAWEVLRWLMKFRELCNGGFHPKLVTPPYHGFLNVNTPPNSQNSKRHYVQHNTQVPVGKHTNRQHASPHHEVATDVKQMPIRPIIINVSYKASISLDEFKT